MKVDYFKQVQESIKLTCNATCFQMDVFLLFMERCCNVESHSQCYRNQKVPGLCHNKISGNIKEFT